MKDLRQRTPTWAARIPVSVLALVIAFAFGTLLGVIGLSIAFVLHSLTTR